MDDYKEEMHQLRNINLQMAQYFVNFCNEHNLLCFFCGGGCIGAVRHHGFIPWDDDLDFFMPREDYEKLDCLWKKYADEKRYSLVKPSYELIDHNLFITIRDNETTQIKPYQQSLDIPHGVAMDIFPLDGFPDGKLQRKLQCYWALVYSLFCSQLVPKNHGIIINLLGRFALLCVPSPHIRYKIWSYAERQMTRYKIENCSGITELCAGPGYMKNRYPKEVFASALWVDFEDTKMPIPVGYDCYLKIAFGDYMQLPPKEKQVPSHDYVFLDLKHGYQQYRGKFYNTLSSKNRQRGNT